MKKVIRGPGFETNSSSSHSVSFGYETAFKPSHIARSYNNENVVVVVAQSFPNDGSRLNDAGSKASYLYAGTSYVSDELVDKYQDLIVAAIKMANPEVEVEFITMDDSYPFGEIDHESTEVPEKVLSAGLDAVYNFIFNPKSSVHLYYYG